MNYENFEEDNFEYINSIIDDCVVVDSFEEGQDPSQMDEDEFIQSLLSRLREELEEEEEEPAQEEDILSVNGLSLDYPDQDLYNMLLEELHDLNESADIIIQQTKGSDFSTPLSELSFNDLSMVFIIILLLFSMGVALIKSNIFHL